MKSNPTWLAAYLYYPEPWETFLCDAVYPFVQEIVALRPETNWFFIRYWERGPHIRLRFCGEPMWLQTVVQPRLDAHFCSYYQHHPAERPEPTGNFKPEEAWYPNLSIQRIPYQPEVARYGGAVGIHIAEQQFQLSSETVLQLMAEQESWSYEQALGMALRLHLGFAWALGWIYRWRSNFLLLLLAVG